MEAAPRSMARRLADFFDTLTTDRRPPRPRRLLPDEEKRALAVQLMATLSRDVLVRSGYRRASPPERPQHRAPSPRPVGDLARTR